eukprot:15354021-Ditylum_brightwellii.AAC.2
MKALQDTIYNEAELSITAQLLSTIWKCCWLSNQPVVMLSIASKGLSLFAVPEMEEDIIDELNKKVESLKVATSTTAKELREVMRVKPIMEHHFSDFILHLKCYTNLCYSLFESASPVYLQVRHAIKALMTLKALA